MVGLVHDQIIVLRQHAPSNGDVRKQQSVVDNDDVSALGSLLGTIEGAVSTSVLHAVFGGAGVVVGREAPPGIGLSRAIEIDLRTVARATLMQPDEQFCQDAQFVGFLWATADEILHPARA